MNAKSKRDRELEKKLAHAEAVLQSQITGRPLDEFDSAAFEARINDNVAQLGRDSIELFKLIDTDKSGGIDFEELRVGLTTNPIVRDMIQQRSHLRHLLEQTTSRTSSKRWTPAMDETRARLATVTCR